MPFFCAYSEIIARIEWVTAMLLSLLRCGVQGNPGHGAARRITGHGAALSATACAGGRDTDTPGVLELRCVSSEQRSDDRTSEQTNIIITTTIIISRDLLVCGAGHRTRVGGRHTRGSGSGCSSTAVPGKGVAGRGARRGQRRPAAAPPGRAGAPGSPAARRQGAGGAGGMRGGKRRGGRRATQRRRLRRKLRRAFGEIARLGQVCKWLSKTLNDAFYEIERLEHELASSETSTQV